VVHFVGGVKVSFGQYAVSINQIKKNSAFFEKKIEYRKVEFKSGNKIPPLKSGGDLSSFASENSSYIVPRSRWTLLLNHGN